MEPADSLEASVYLESSDAQALLTAENPSRVRTRSLMVTMLCIVCREDGIQFLPNAATIP